jgi:hypothetical protein
MCVALVIQLAKRMRRLILSSVACPAVPVFSIDFLQILRIKFHENPSSRSGFIPCGRTDMTLFAILRTHVKWLSIMTTNSMRVCCGIASRNLVSDGYSSDSYHWPAWLWWCLSLSLWSESVISLEPCTTQFICLYSSRHVIITDNTVPLGATQLLHHLFL